MRPCVRVTVVCVSGVCVCGSGVYAYFRIDNV